MKRHFREARVAACNVVNGEGAIVRFLGAGKLGSAAEGVAVVAVCQDPDAKPQCRICGQHLYWDVSKASI